MDLALIAFAVTLLAAVARIMVYFDRLQRVSNDSHELLLQIRDQIRGLREDWRSRERL